jgi:phosphoglycerol transferase MdoB-like AlkP superfamily enzyme
MRSLMGLAALAVLILAVVLWFWIEPVLVGWFTGSLCLGAALLIAFMVFSNARPEGLDRLANDVAPQPDPADAKRLGLIGSILIHFIRWQAGPASFAPPAPIQLGLASPRVIVIVQIESFADPADWSWNGPRLPNLALAQRRAVISGRLTLPCIGAFTMRPEFEMLTGIGCGELGFDCFNPYLRGEAFAAAALPLRMRAAGYRTVFIHPHDPRFFARNELMPRFGFDEFIDESEFAGAERRGPYISDVEAGRRVIAEIGSGQQPVFIFCATMENHGPWLPERLPGLSAVEQYAAHLQNADLMIGEIVAALDARRVPALLAFYGDHVPILGETVRTAMTPFAVLSWSVEKQRARNVPVSYSTWNLHRDIVEMIISGPSASKGG